MGQLLYFAAQPFTTKLISSNENDFRYCWYWLKNQGSNFFQAKRMPIRKIEEICIFKKGRYYPQIKEVGVPTNSAKGRSKGKVYSGINTRNYEGGETTRLPTNIYWSLNAFPITTDFIVHKNQSIYWNILSRHIPMKMI